MHSAWWFLILAFVVTAIWGAWSYRNVDFWAHIKTEEGKGEIASALRAFAVLVLVILAYVLTGCSAPKGAWLNDAGVYAGLDYVNKISPVCQAGYNDNRTTSNLGFWGNLWRSEDKRLRVNAKYTHHSCAFSPDARSYDGAGVEFEYEFYRRK